LPVSTLDAHAAEVDEVVMQPAGTLRGQLQRGLGRGARRAAQVRGAGEIVYDCIRQDPRWDRQVESRSLYYARLMMDLELSAVPLAEHLFDPVDLVEPDETRTELTIEVLADLVRLSRRDAAGPLRRYAVDGENWYAALDALTSLGDPSLTEGLAEVAVTRCDDDDLHWLVADTDNPVVRAWAARYPRIEEAVRRRAGERPRRREPDQSRRGDAELLASARQADPEAVAAILELGRRRHPALLDLAEEILPARGRQGGAVCRAVRDLGPLALPRARAWVRRPTGCQDLGIGILARFGTQQDIPALLADLDDAVVKEAWGAAASPVEGLGRLRAGEAVPLLKRAWTESAYSYLRPRLLTALLRTAPHTAESYAIEGLWDCEDDVRQIAAGSSPLTDDTRLRLERLHADNAEDPSVWTAVGTRLATL
jgi:hypothetical protein